MEFNGGKTSVKDIMNVLDTPLSTQSEMQMKKVDATRVANAERKSSSDYKVRRIKSKARKKQSKEEGKKVYGYGLEGIEIAEEVCEEL